MKIKTSDLSDIALDYAVGMAIGHDMSKAVSYGSYLRIPAHAGSAYTVTFCPSTDWTIGGPLIEREAIELVPDGKGSWCAAIRGGDEDDVAQGPTPLIAAMRCVVASRLGDEVDIPNELCIP